MARRLIFLLISSVLLTFLATNSLATETDCKVTNSFQKIPGWSINGFGFPKNDLSLTSTGTLTIPIVFITYPDLRKPTEKDAKNLYKYFAKESTAYFKNSSHGKLKIILKPNFSWLTMSRPSNTYQAVGNSGQIRDEIYALARSSINFNGTTGLVAVSDPATNFPDHMFGIAEGPKSFALVGTNQFYKYPAADFIHELFHAFGLPDLQNFVDNYSIMGNSHSGTELLAWEQYILGWISDNQVACLNQGTKKVKLNPASSRKGTKLAAVRIDANQVLLVETRKPTRYDSAEKNFGNAHYQYKKFKNDGPLVYLVNSSISDPNQGPLRLLNNKQPMKLGKTFRYENVEIKYESKSPKDDTIIIRVN